MATRRVSKQLRQGFLDYDDCPLRSVCQAIADDPPMLQLAAQGRVGSFMPFFFLSCVRYLFLKHPEHPLSAYVIGPKDAGEMSPLQYRAFRKYCLAHKATLLRLLATARTQTNDVLRSAVLFPAFALASKRSKGRPLGLVEVGASAGLNLCWDQFRYDYGERGCFGVEDSGVRLRLDWLGEPPGRWLKSVPEVGSRIGIDLHPIDLENEAEVLWLRSFMGDPSGTLEAAIALARASRLQLRQGDAVELLADAVRAVPKGEVPCVFHSYCTYQFSMPALERFEARIAELGGERPLHWVRLEGQSLELTSFRPGRTSSWELLATTDLAGGVHRWFEWCHREPRV